MGERPRPLPRRRRPGPSELAPAWQQLETERPPTGSLPLAPVLPRRSYGGLSESEFRNEAYRGTGRELMANEFNRPPEMYRGERVLGPFLELTGAPSLVRSYARARDGDPLGSAGEAAMGALAIGGVRAAMREPIPMPRQALAAPATLPRSQTPMADLILGRSTESEANVFIGPRSALWDPNRAARAAQMEYVGLSPEQIWAETGTFRGAHGVWRQESGYVPFNTVYPNARMHIADGWAPHGSAWAFPLGPSNLVGLSSSANAVEISHELGHVAQRIEGINSGGNPISAGLRAVLRGENPRGAYERLPGEIDAEAAARRWHLRNDELAARFPGEARVSRDPMPAPLPMTQPWPADMFGALPREPMPRPQPRLPGRASDGSILPVAPSRPFTNSLRGGSDDLSEAAVMGEPRIEVSGNNRVIYVSHRGNEYQFRVIDNADGTTFVDMPELPIAAQNQGIARRAYIAAINDAERRGRVFVSGGAVSPSAARIYDSLERRGYEVTRRPGWDDSLDESTLGFYGDEDGPPLFTVRRPPQ